MFLSSGEHVLTKGEKKFHQHTVTLITGYKASMVYYIVSYARIILLNIDYTAYSPHIGTLARTLLVVDIMSSQMHFRWEIPMTTCLIWKASQNLYNKIIFFLHPISLLFSTIPLYISSLLYLFLPLKFFPPFSSFSPSYLPWKASQMDLKSSSPPPRVGGGGKELYTNPVRIGSIIVIIALVKFLKMTSGYPYLLFFLG